MVTIAELKEFCESWVAERENLENYFMVASDDELNRLYQDTVNSRENCTFACVIPTHDSDIEDEDNRQLKNNLYFMILKKTDSKAGHDAKIDIFAKTQLEAKALLIKIIDLHHNFGDNCAFRDIDLNSFRIDPVQDYLGANGYQIEFASSTDF